MTFSPADLAVLGVAVALFLGGQWVHFRPLRADIAQIKSLLTGDVTKLSEDVTKLTSAVAELSGRVEALEDAVSERDGKKGGRGG